MRAQDPDSISSTRAGVWVLAALLPPFVLRGAALIDSRIELGIPDLHGFLSDLGLGLLVAAAAAAAARGSRWLGAGMLVVWVGAGQGNYEHVVANGANLSLADAGNLADKTFVVGSVLRPTAPVLLVSLVAITVFLGRPVLAELADWEQLAGVQQAHQPVEGDERREIEIPEQVDLVSCCGVLADQLVGIKRRVGAAGVLLPQNHPHAIRGGH